MKKNMHIWKTKFKITNIFLVFYITIFVFILIFNFYIIGLRLINVPKISDFNPEKFTRNFEKYITISEAGVEISNEGKDILKKHGAWIQILNSNLKEVNSVYTPSNIPLKYTTLELVHGHKYDIENNSIFIYEKEDQNKKYIYIVGFSLDDIAKHTIVFHPSEYRSIFTKIIFILVVDIFVIIFLAYLVLARKFANPINKIIEAIDYLACGEYDKKYSEKGIYKHVFYNLNSLGYVLNKSLEKRKEIEQVRREWIYSISHDLKTPLASIKGFAEIMKNQDYSFSEHEMKNYSRIIWEKSVFIQSLIEDLNLTSKLENKLIPLKIKRIKMNDFLKDIILQIQNDPIYIKYKLIFKDSKDKIYANIDEDLMKRAIFNLIINSLKYNNENIIVEVIIYQRDDVCIVIKDNGIGIKENDLKHIFERYYRGTNTSSSTEGSGLGMAIAKEIIHLHHGDVFVQSKVNEGVEITIQLH
ncbi:MAG: HAMP domain-containing histidine kinase [Marinisporobacter sp.]|jgi:signal transduction histidine kinase|nr:HAMP domain-containing histidine kinase [Marinisporobacter sp.]